VLYYAAKTGDPDFVQYLLDRGVPIVSGGYSPLSIAAEKGHTGVVRLLLDAGADPNWNQGYSLRIAAQNGHTAVVETLLTRAPIRDQDIALHNAAFSGRIDIVRLLLAAGCDLNSGGVAALYRAAEGGHTEIAALLIDAGIDPAPILQTQMVPMTFAARGGHYDVAKLLIERGFWTPGQESQSLEWAVTHRRVRVVRLLIQCGADPSALSPQVRAQLSRMLL
jgi:ankyrin repeat domain-containing protein 17